MQALYLLIPLSIGIVFVAIRVFFECLRVASSTIWPGPGRAFYKIGTINSPVEPGKAEVITVIPPAAPD